MTMAAATLSNQLQAISGADEAAAITSWVLAWQTYFAASVSNGSNPFIPNVGARNAMAAALAGFSVSGQGPTKVQAGIVAWWGALSASPGTYYSGVSSVTPPSGITNIAANLPAIFTSNKNGALSSSAACGTVAASIHTSNSGGSTNAGAIT